MLTALAVACGGDGGTVASPSAGPPSDTPATPPPATQPGPDLGGATLVQPRPGMVDTHPIAWEEADIAADDRTLTVFWYSGVEPCAVLDSVVALEGADDVAVTVIEGRDPEAGDVACIDIAQYKATTVVLDTPLGDREVVDGGAVA